MNKSIATVALTDVGKMRTKNEDNFIELPSLWQKDSVVLIGAIDGVGGYAGGAEAALLAKNTVEHYLQNFSFGAPLQLLKEAVIRANNAIHEQRITNEQLQRMSCVCSVGLLDAEKEMLYIAHVGDSRGYIFRNQQMLKITRDHSVVGMKEDSGYLTEEEAMHHPRRNEISKMLGEVLLDAEDEEQYIQLTEHSFLPNDIVLFCSDGLTDLVTQQQMIAILEQGIDLQQKAKLLIDKANSLGGKDNITVALAQFNATDIPRKKSTGKKAIEIPISETNTPAIEVAEITPVMPAKNKKYLWLLLPLAFIIGFLANWNGSSSFFSPKAVTPVVDTNLNNRDSLLLDSIPDTLINTTDTIPVRPQPTTVTHP